MTDIKRQVLTRLYALRGSISYLSQEVKGFTQKEELATKALEEIEDKYCEEESGKTFIAASKSNQPAAAHRRPTLQVVLDKPIFGCKF